MPKTMEETQLSDPETSPSDSTGEHENGVNSFEFGSLVDDSDDEESGSALDDSHSGGTEGLGGRSTATTESDEEGIAGKDGTTLVCISRTFFFVLLFACSFVLSGYIFATMREDENSNFEAHVSLIHVTPKDNAGRFSDIQFLILFRVLRQLCCSLKFSRRNS
jgi:hypothetical protein